MSVIDSTDDKTNGKPNVRRGYIRRDNLPADISDAHPRTLRVLCDAGWSTTDIADQFGERRDIVKRHLNAIGVSPSNTKSPWRQGDNGDGDGMAAYLWRVDPEDVGLTSAPSDWNHITTIPRDDGPRRDSHSLAEYTGGDSDE